MRFLLWKTNLYSSCSHRLNLSWWAELTKGNIHRHILEITADSFHRWKGFFLWYCLLSYILPCLSLNGKKTNKKNTYIPLFYLLYMCIPDLLSFYLNLPVSVVPVSTTSWLWRFACLSLAFPSFVYVARAPLCTLDISANDCFPSTSHQEMILSTRFWIHLLLRYYLAWSGQWEWNHRVWQLKLIIVLVV